MNGRSAPGALVAPGPAGGCTKREVPGGVEGGSGRGGWVVRDLLPAGDVGVLAEMV